MRTTAGIGVNLNGIRAAVAAACCVVLVAVGVAGREISIPEETALRGNVAIAEWFYRPADADGFEEPRVLQVWPGDSGLREPDYFDTLILAAPGDVIVLSPGSYTADLWIYSPNITITTAGSPASGFGDSGTTAGSPASGSGDSGITSQDPDTDQVVRASIWGTVEIDADRVTLDSIEVTGPRKLTSSGHGIEVNREVARFVSIRNCRSAGNDWTGIHMIGIRGQMIEMRVENCELAGNGMDGLDAQNIESLIITGCIVTGNAAAGLRINRYINNILLENNVVSGNREGNIIGSGI